MAGEHDGTLTGRRDDMIARRARCRDIGFLPTCKGRNRPGQHLDFKAWNRTPELGAIGVFKGIDDQLVVAGFHGAIWQIDLHLMA